MLSVAFAYLTYVNAVRVVHLRVSSGSSRDSAGSRECGSRTRPRETTRERRENNDVRLEGPASVPSQFEPRCASRCTSRLLFLLLLLLLLLLPLFLPVVVSRVGLAQNSLSQLFSDSIKRES